MSLNELADILDVSRQQVSAWENGVKTISQKRLRQLSEYFGVDEKFFWIYQRMIKSLLFPKPVPSSGQWKRGILFCKTGRDADDFKYRPFSYPDFEESLDEHMIRAKRKKKRYNRGNTRGNGIFLASRIRLLRRFLQLIVGCKVYDGTYKIFWDKCQMRIRDQLVIWPEMLFSLLIANGVNQLGHWMAEDPCLYVLETVNRFLSAEASIR